MKRRRALIEMPISFGSFGDVVTILQLARRAQVALTAAGSARTEINSVIVDVSAYKRSLETIRDRLTQRPSALESTVEAGIQDLFATCDSTLNGIMRKLAPFLESTPGDRRRLRRFWTLFAWSALGDRESVDVLRARLPGQIAALTALLSLVHSADLETLTRVVEEHGATLRDLNNSFHQVYRMPNNATAPQLIWDPLAERHYQAYARTSLSRLQDLHSLAQAGIHNRPFILNLDALTGDLRVGNAGPVANLHCIHIKFWVFLRTPLVLSCVLWRGHAFDHWQALVGLPGPWRLLFGGQDRIRMFLERREIHKDACGCAPPCRELLLGLPGADELRDLVRADQETALYRFYNRFAIPCDDEVSSGDSSVAS